MSQKSPLARVKDEFGGKDKLVDKILALLGSPEHESKEDLRKRLLGAANSKLIRLYAVAATVKEKHGSRDQLAGAVAAHLGHAKDSDYAAKLSAASSAKLLDLLANRRGARPPASTAKTA